MNFKRLFKQILLLSSCPTYGGQAVMGGVMMKGKNTYSVSLYNNNEVHTKSFPFKSLTQKVKFLGLPFIRGIIMLFEMLIIGYKSLSYSSEFEYTKETEDESSAFGIMMIISLIFSLFFRTNLLISLMSTPKPSYNSFRFLNSISLLLYNR